MDVSQFFIDFLFYSVVDGMIYLLVRDTIRNKNDFNFNISIFYAVVISLFLCILKYFIPNAYAFSFIFAIVLSSFYLLVLKDKSERAFIYGFVSVFYLFCIELIIVIITNCLNMNVLSVSLGSFYRVFIFIIAKAIEIFGLLCWRKYKNEISNRNCNS